MNPTPTLTTVEPWIPTKPKRGRLFYAGAATLVLVLMLLGFQKYYLQGKTSAGHDIPVAKQTVILLHASVMTMWFVLFLVQPLLIASGRRRLHMAIGRFGAVLAFGVVVLGAWVAIQAASSAPPEDRMFGLTIKAFCLLAISNVVMFGVLVSVAVYYRHRPKIQRPMMLMATLIVIPAAVDRIGPVLSLYEGTVLELIFGPLISTLVIATLLLGVKWLVSGSIDRWFAIAYGYVVVYCLLVWRLTNTDAWEQLAALLL